MTTCTATTAKGTPCRARPLQGADLCALHGLAPEERRARAHAAAEASVEARRPRPKLGPSDASRKSWATRRANKAVRARRAAATVTVTAPSWLTPTTAEELAQHTAPKPPPEPEVVEQQPKRHPKPISDALWERVQAALHKDALSAVQRAQDRRDAEERRELQQWADSSWSPFE